MLKVIVGSFLILHGLVHFLYVGLSRKMFELEPPLAGWPERSWAFSRFLDVPTTRTLASGLYVLAIVIFVLGGVGYLMEADWWTPLVIAASVFSSGVIFLFWDGTTQKLSEKGFIGILINAVVVVAVLAA